MFLFSYIASPAPFNSVVNIGQASGNGDMRKHSHTRFIRMRKMGYRAGFCPGDESGEPGRRFLNPQKLWLVFFFFVGFSFLIAGSSQHPVLDNIVLCRRFFEMVMWKFTRVAELNSHVWCKRKVKGTFGSPSAPLQRMSSISCLLKVPRRKKAINSTKHNGFDTNQK